jgi:hypothetical protein
VKPSIRQEIETRPNPDQPSDEMKEPEKLMQEECYFCYHFQSVIDPGQ